VKKTPAIVITLTLGIAAVVVGCATGASSGANADQVAAQMVKTGFRTQGIANIERATAIDETLQACNAADVAGKPLDAAVAKRLEEANLKTVKWPERGMLEQAL
jgi:sulfur-oxidizing protein SoxX